MSTLIAIGEEQRTPLLHNTSSNGNDERIASSSPSHEPDADAPKLTLRHSNQRLPSLDVFRGLTVTGWGVWFPSIDHAPWFGVTVADFVMPFSLFGVGVSISLVFKKATSKPLATKKVILRTIKLFLLGLFLQGRYFHGHNNLTYGVDVDNIRWLGVLQVHCGVRGCLDPPCNAVGYIDLYFLGEQHLYQHPVYRRTNSLMAVLTCFVGLHFGHILLNYKGQIQRVLFWSMTSFPFLISGFGLDMLGIPFSKPLYTLSYMCITAGASGLFLTKIFHIVDVKHFRKPFVLLQWMGMNALIIYALAACDIFPAALQGFYWRSPENNWVDGMESLLQAKQMGYPRICIAGDLILVPCCRFSPLE